MYIIIYYSVSFVMLLLFPSEIENDRGNRLSKTITFVILCFFFFSIFHVFLQQSFSFSAAINVCFVIHCTKGRNKTKEVETALFWLFKVI